MASSVKAGDHLYDDPELAGFYDHDNEARADFEYCLRLAAGARSVLDLGCGTGQLAAALAEGRSVAGIDPAGGMLDIARKRPGGQRVEWIQADARKIRLDRRFDLVVLTGHAFQVFLTSDDQAAVLRTIAHHLTPSGRFIFDTRNPAAKEWLEWGPEASLRFIAHPEFGQVKAWNTAAYDPAIRVVTYETHYEIPDAGRRFSAASRIAFPTKDSLAELIEEAGLATDRWLGDWQGNGFTPEAREIIPIGRRR
jgi:SAM-dependent methyltransferase